MELLAEIVLSWNGSRGEPVTSAAVAAFKGWPAEAFDFYEGLEADNSKAYWTEHKAVYEDCVRAPFEALMTDLASEFGPGKLFRPYRDVRFAADKSPYKTAQGAVLNHDTGTVYYVAALGRRALRRVGLLHDGQGPDRPVPQGGGERQDRPAARAGRGQAEKAGYDIGGEALRRSPPGYPVDHPRIRLLRHKGVTMSKSWEPAAWVGTASARTRVVAVFRAAKPLNDWLDAHVGRSKRRGSRRVVAGAFPQPGAIVVDEQMCELLLIRHGRSADVVPGSDESLDPPLHDLGHRAGRGPRPPFGRTRSSPRSTRPTWPPRCRPPATSRCHTTSRCSSGRISARCGSANGSAVSSARRARPRDPEWLAFARAGRWDLVPGSEGDDALRTRASRPRSARSRQRHRGETVAVVVHGGVINAFLAASFETTPSWFGLIENTSVTVVLAGATRRILVTVNDCAHLYDLVVERPAP